MSPSATAAMARNVEINGLGASTTPNREDAPEVLNAQNLSDERKSRTENLSIVRINEGDAW